MRLKEKLALDYSRKLLPAPYSDLAREAVARDFLEGFESARKMAETEITLEVLQNTPASAIRMIRNLGEDEN